MRKYCTLLGFALLTVITARATVHYVKPGGTGTAPYTSWATADSNLQTVINAAVAGDSVFVAAGTYQPASGSSFSMKEGVRIFGHFAGTETAFAQRNLSSTDTSKLLGNGNSVISNENNGLTHAAVLDGFTITGGNATNNGGTNGGGGMYNYNVSPTISNCILSNNTGTGTVGGGMYNDINASPIIINCIFWGNIATSNAGGGMYNYYNSSPTIINCIFSGNSASIGAAYGGGIYNSVSSSPTISNCIIYGNSSGIDNDGSSTSTVTYSDIQGGYDGTGNINADPLFVSAADFHLQPGSPCINAGINLAVLTGDTADIEGQPRIQNCTVDMGAYESGYFTNKLYVNAAIAASGNGHSWTTAFKTLDEALSLAASCGSTDSILVAAGTYFPNNIAGNGSTDRDKAFVLLPGVHLLGGYNAGTGTRNISANPTILSGDIGAAGNNTDNCYHILIAGDSMGTAALDGFTLTGGNANGSGSITINGHSLEQNNGGAMYCYQASPLITRCSFSGNMAANAGGALFNNQDAAPAVTLCTFSNNISAFNGGAMYNYQSAAPLIDASVFSGNKATGSGGALYNDNGTQAIVTNCLFTADTAAAGNGGALYNYTASPQVINCTFTRNSANAGGTAIFNAFSSSTMVTNGILWDGPNSVGNSSNSTLSITYSDVQGGYAGTGNINADPLFSDTVAGNFRLLSGSPAINTGNNAAVSGTTDIQNMDRIMNGTVDMGAYETVSYTAVYVDSANGNDTNPGNSWTSAFSTLSHALEFAGNQHSVDSILVAKGTYYPTGMQSGTDRDSAFTILRGGLKLYGGYPNGGGARDAVANPVYLDGNINNANDSADNSYHVMVIAGLASNADSVVIDGFSFRNGEASLSSSTKEYNGQNVARDNGGGIILHNNALGNKLVVRHCTFTHNYAVSGGGLLCHTNANALISHCTFTDNTAVNGGGLYTYNGSSPAINNCTFDANIAAGSGGGMFNDADCAPVIDNCIFKNNVSQSNSHVGGGMDNNGASPTVNNCVFHNNTAGFGGGIYNDNSSSLTVKNCTLTANTAINLGLGAGGGICNNNSTAFIGNTIIWGNIAYNGGDNIIIRNGGSLTIANSDIQGSGGSANWNAASYGTDGGGNIDADPLFSNAANGDFTLQFGSPAFNAGNNDSIPAGITTDLAGNARLSGGRVDMGAYEYFYNYTTLYVDSSNTAGGNGSSWATAFSGLSEALRIAKTDTLVDSILVAKGTYFPEDTAGDGSRERDKAFVLLPNVKLYGGFQPGGAGSWQARALPSANNPHEGTILSGDFSQNDTITGSGQTLSITGNDENAYHVVIAAGDVGSALMDGFIITGGNADFSGLGGTITVNSQFISRKYGGGIYSSAASPALTNLLVWGNTSDANGGGGGIYDEDVSSLSLTNSHISRNISGSRGGGILSSVQSAPVLTGVTIEGNKAATNGGGMNNIGATPVLTRVTINNNYAGVYGGGICTSNLSSDILNDCILSNNHAGANGGGLYAAGNSPTLSGVAISGNTANGGGGGIYNTGNAQLSNVLLSGNAAGGGGGIYNDLHVQLNTVTISGNTANGGGGGGMRNDWSGATAQIHNSIISGNHNSGGGIANINNDSYSPGSYGPAVPVFSNSLIEGSGGSGAGWVSSFGTDNGGNIDVNPLFTDTANADYSLQSGSPAIDAGSNTFLVAGDTIDLAGNARLSGSSVDMGAYEYFYNYTTLYVDSSNTAGGNGSSWATAFSGLSEALRIAKTDTLVDSILVAKGTYFPEDTAGDGSRERDKAFVLLPNVKLYGGFQPGGAGSWQARALPSANNPHEGTILSGDFSQNDTITGSGQTLSITGNDENAYHVVIAAGDVGSALMDGFIITGGNADVAGHAGGVTVNGQLISRKNSGGIYSSAASPALANLLVWGNTGGNGVGGGGIFITGNSTLSLSQSHISRNIANSGGGGILNGAQSAPVLTDVTIESNKAGSNGGGMNNTGATPVLTRVTINNNYTAASGGGIFSTNSSDILYNCVLRNNRADINGGGLYTTNANSSTLSNVTISGNTAGANGGGIFNSDNVQLSNVLLSGNAAGSDDGGGIYNMSRAQLTNVTISGNTANGGGGGMRNTSAQCVVKIHNSIISSNHNSSGIANINNDSYLPGSYGPAVPVFSNSLIEGSGSSGAGWVSSFGTDSSGNIDVNPLFTDTANADYSLQSGSPAIDAGSNTFLVAGDTIDLAGNARLSGSSVDMGAYEFQGSALSLQLISFSGKAENCTARLQWLTVNEENLSGFELQESKNAYDFTTAAQQNAKNAPGQNRYNQTLPLTEGKSYFRLKATEQNGNFIYSRVLMLQSDCGHTDITVYPNPGTGLLYIRNAAAGSSYTLSDLSGRSLLSGTITENLQTLSFKHLSAGVYILSIKGNSGRHQIKVVKGR